MPSSVAGAGNKATNKAEKVPVFMELKCFRCNVPDFCHGWSGSNYFFESVLLSTNIE